MGVRKGSLGEFTAGAGRGLEIEGGHAYGMLVAETGIPGRVTIPYHSGRQGEKEQRHPFMVTTESITDPLFQVNTAGVRQGILDGTLGIALDLPKGDFRLPAGADGASSVKGKLDVDKHFTRALPAHEDDLDKVVRERLMWNLQLYMQQLLSNTMVPQIPK